MVSLVRVLSNTSCCDRINL